MSVRSGLLLQAQKQVSNPFLLCTLISKRTRQLVIGSNGVSRTADLMDHAFSELIAGGLEFRVPGTECFSLRAAEDGRSRKDEAPAQRGRPAATAGAIARAEAT